MNAEVLLFNKNVRYKIKTLTGNILLHNEYFIFVNLSIFHW